MKELIKKVLFGLIDTFGIIIIICLPLVVSIVGIIAGISFLAGNKLIKKSKYGGLKWIQNKEKE